MTHTEMNLAIAKHIGWHGIEETGLLIVGGSWIGYPPKNFIVGKKTHIPDFAGDLNEMHKAESRLALEQQRDYLHQLAAVTQERGASSLWRCVTATAEQRAEAFLKTFNLFVEDKNQ